MSALGGLHDDEPALTQKLLQRFDKTYTTAFASGHHFEPRSMRVHGRDANDPEARDQCVTFSSFLYLAMLDPLSGAVMTSSIARHRTRSLLQFKYAQESTFSRDQEQVVRNLEHVSGRQFLHVPQLWSLLLDSGMATAILS